jgi:hypothetical protein
MQTPIAIATEDELSEAVCERLLAELAPKREIDIKFRRNGSGYLRTSFDKFLSLAQLRPVLLLTDLDSASCAVSLINTWHGRRRPEPNLLFRVACREVESWLLADTDGIRKLFRQRQIRIPANADELSDPKRSLIDFARRAPREIRDEVCPDLGSPASQGVGYNARLGAFVADKWDFRAAAARSQSLHRAVLRLSELA